MTTSEYYRYLRTLYDRDEMPDMYKDLNGDLDLDKYKPLFKTWFGDEEDWKEFKILYALNKWTAEMR